MGDVDSGMARQASMHRQEASLFIGSSQDLREARITLFNVLRGLLASLPTPEPILPREWETSTAERPMDQRKSRQENIGRPSDAGCVGTICLFGELVGTVLREFDPAQLKNWDDWSSASQRWHAVHPWPSDEAAQLACVEAGGFPVTGTVFEALDALASGRPVYVAYFAQRKLPPEGEFTVLNGQAWRQVKTTQMQDGRKASAWIDGEYRIQTRAVENFLRALSLRTQPQWHPDVEAAKAAIERFVRTHFELQHASEDNPYRFLDFYDIGDHGVLVGRQDIGRRAVGAIRSHAADPGTGPLVLRLTGESGCGKTSCLRAGILGALLGPTDLGRFRVVAVRPTDFHDNHGQPEERLLDRLMRIIARDTPDLNLLAGDLDTLARSGARAPRLAVDMLVRALARLDDAKCGKFLVIGLDQFEEIVDDLAAADRRPYATRWRPLIDFVGTAATCGRMAFVYTLESTREAAFDRLAPTLGALGCPQDDLRLGGHSDAFLAQVIEQPFEQAGFPLAREVVDLLLARYKAYEGGGRNRASSLPLLALKLSNLFDHVRSIRSARAPGGNRPGLGGAFGSRPEPLGVAELDGLLDFHNEIEDLAQRVWNHSAASEEEQLGDLNFVLQPLVALSGNDLDEITLQTVGDGLFADDLQRLKAFEEVRLVVRDNGRRRLIHEAVIRQWPLAARWLETQRRYLIRESQFRTSANAWAALGAQDADLPADPASIDFAAVVLRQYIRLWPTGAEEALPPGDRHLRAYCLQTFARSQAPLNDDKGYFPYHSSHVHLAASYGLDDLLRRFIALEPGCIEHRNAAERTPLLAAAWIHISTVELLIAHGADPNVRDENGWSPISIAVWQRHDAMFRVLLRHVRGPDDLVAPGGSLLHLAARRGAVGIARELVHGRGANPFELDGNGHSPAANAAWYGQVEALDFFLGLPGCPEPAPGKGNPLHLAAGEGHARAIARLLDLSAHAALADARDADGMTPLMHAAQQRREAAVRTLLPTCDVNLPCGGPEHADWTALHFAIAGPQPAAYETRTSRQAALLTARALLEAPGLDLMAPTAAGETAMSLARNLPLVRSLLMTDPRFRHNERLADGSTPLGLLIEQRDRAGVERLLRLPDLDLQLLSKDGAYAFERMLKNEMVDLALALLEAGRFQPWQVEGAGNIGLRALVELGDEPSLERLLAQAPAQPTPAQRRHLAAGAAAAIVQHRPLALLSRLIELGADQGPVDAENWNLVHLAAACGNLGAFDRLASTFPWGPSLVVGLGRRPSEVAPDALAAAVASRERSAPNVPEDLATAMATRPEFRRAHALPDAGRAFSFADPEWREVERTSLDHGRLLPVDGRIVLDGTVRARALPLPFYDGWRLLELRSERWPAGTRLCWLESATEAYRLNGMSWPFHELNKKVPIRLDDHNVLFYAVLFCLFVQAEEGPFLLVHDLADTLLPGAYAQLRPERSPAAPLVGDLFRAPRVFRREGDEYWHISAQLHYGDHLFDIDLTVAPSGFVEMRRDVAISDRLSWRPALPLDLPART